MPTGAPRRRRPKQRARIVKYKFRPDAKPEKEPGPAPIRRLTERPVVLTAMTRWAQHIDRCDQCNKAFDFDGEWYVRLCEDGTELYRQRIDEETEKNNA